MNDYPIFLPPFAIPKQPDVYAASTLQSWATKFLRLPESWLARGGQGVKIAVLDTGCDVTHPDLMTKAILSVDFTNSPTKDRDFNGHGTHCISTAAGYGKYIGIAPLSTVISGKVMRDDGTGIEAWSAAAINWAVDQGADLISMSFGSPGEPSAAMGQAIRRAYAKGVWLFAAAGNSGQRGVDYPGAFDETVAVAALGPNGLLANFSGRGDKVTIAAPGVDILACWPTNLDKQNPYRRLSGTSMATPVVAGLAACALSELRSRGIAKPSPQRVLELIAEHASDMGPVGRDSGYGYGVMYGDKLLSIIPDAPKPVEPEPPVAERDFWDAVRDVQRLTPPGMKAKVVLEANA